jgi:hypothetical protein
LRTTMDPYIYEVWGGGGDPGIRAAVLVVKI